jgi:hypothetical protein
LLGDIFPALALWVFGQNSLFAHQVRVLKRRVIKGTDQRIDSD